MTPQTSGLNSASTSSFVLVELEIPNICIQIDIPPLIHYHVNFDANIFITLCLNLHFSCKSKYNLIAIFTIQHFNQTPTYLTSSSSISYCSNIEHWSQIRTQSRNFFAYLNHSFFFNKC